MFVIPGDGSTLKSCGYVEDLISAFTFMEAQNDPVILFNFCNPEQPSVNEICTTMKTAAGLPGPMGRIPAFILHPLGAVFEGLNAVGVKTPINRARIDKLLRSTNIEAAELKKRGFNWGYNLEEALAKWSKTSGGEMI